MNRLRQAITQQINKAIVRSDKNEAPLDIDKYATDAILEVFIEALPEETVTREDLCPYCYEDKEAGLTPYNAGKSLAVREIKSILEAAKENK